MDIFQTTSEWTLDYPPLFAYAEHALSRLAPLASPLLTRLVDVCDPDWGTIAFQRASVVISELVLAWVLLL